MPITIDGRSGVLLYVKDNGYAVIIVPEVYGNTPKTVPMATVTLV